MINLADYNELFQEKMGLMVDQVISGLQNGSVVFYNINTTRNHWNKAEKTKGNNGWYYNSAGGITTESDTTKNSQSGDQCHDRTLTVYPVMGRRGQTSVDFNVGFAVKGPDTTITYVSPSTYPILTHSTRDDERHHSGRRLCIVWFDLNNYRETIALCMDMTLEEFLASIDTFGGTVRMHVVNPRSGEWDETSEYTANAPGYWMTSLGAVCSWGATDFTLYAELAAGDKMLYIGRAPGLAAGNKYTVSIGFRDTVNPSYFFRFIITATLT